MLLGKKCVSKGKTMFFPLALLFFHWGIIGESAKARTFSLWKSRSHDLVRRW